MKLGIITFVDAAGDEGLRQQAEYANWLNRQNHNVVAAEDVVRSGAAAASEAERIARAEVDGVLFHVCAGARPDHGLQAALRAHRPLLIVGSDVRAFFAFAGALQEVGVGVGRALGGGEDPDTQTQIVRWLSTHEPVERQRGEEAAQKLYGMRLGIFGGNGAHVDRAQWLSQFGVFVQHAPALAREEEAIDAFCAREQVDFRAPDGDACGALTTQLLRLIGGEPVFCFDLRYHDPNKNRWTVTTSVGEVNGPAGTGDATALTLARITRRAGRFVCVVLRGEHEDATGLRLDGLHSALVATLAAPRLHAAPGNLEGALKAACEALDIEPIFI